MSTGINIGKKIAILEEGSSITPDVNQINFTGASVTATATGNNVTVNVTGAGLTIGTTAITSGTVSRVLFEGTGNVLQQDANFTFDSTLKRLTLKASGGTISDIPFVVQNSAGTGNLGYINGIGDVAFGTTTITTGSGGDGQVVAIGAGAQVWSGYTGYPIAIGKNTAASGGSIAIGNGAVAASGTQSIVNNISIGTGATTLSTATDCVAIGRAAVTGQASSTIAIGAGINFGGYLGGTNIALGTYLNGGSFTGGAYAIGSGVSDASRATLDIADSFSIYFKNNNRSFFVNKNTNIVLRSTATLTSGTHFDASATNTFTIHNGTIPTTNIANAGQIYVESGTLRFRDSAGTITNVGGSVQSVASAATVTPVYTNKFVKITAQAVGLTLANPTGTWAEGQELIIRIKDSGSAQTIAYDTNYRAIGVTLPTTTTASKTTYLGIIYNSDDAKWDVIGVTTQA